MPIDPDDDEFFGDQSSESDYTYANNANQGSNKGIREEIPSSDPFGNVANHDYRSREASIKTLSYLDGYDETKEEKLQDGFSEGYRQSFKDAFRIGRHLGSLCVKAALDESVTLGLKPESNINDANAENSDHDTAKKCVKHPANLVRQFLTDEIIIGSRDGAENRYEEAFLKLEEQLKKI